METGERRRSREVGQADSCVQRRLAGSFPRNDNFVSGAAPPFSFSFSEIPRVRAMPRIATSAPIGSQTEPDRGFSLSDNATNQDLAGHHASYTTSRSRRGRRRFGGFV